MKALSWIIALIGVWEVIAPFVLGFGTVTTGVWNNIAVGIVFIVFGAVAALIRNVGTARALNWINALVGLWLLVSPFVLGTAIFATALWNDVIVGIVVMILGAWAALSARPVTTV